MKSKILFTFLTVMFVTTAMAQNILKGTITDAEDSKPLAGADNTFGSNAAISDNAGLFSIQCKTGSLLTMSFIGYETQKKYVSD